MCHLKQPEATKGGNYENDDDDVFHYSTDWEREFEFCSEVCPERH